MLSYRLARGGVGSAGTAAEWSGRRDRAVGAWSWSGQVRSPSQQTACALQARPEELAIRAVEGQAKASSSMRGDAPRRETSEAQCSRREPPKPA